MFEGKELYKQIITVVGLGLAIAAFSILGVAMLAAVVVVGLIALAVFGIFLAYLRMKRFFLQRGRPKAPAPGPEPRSYGRAENPDTRFVDVVDVSAETDAAEPAAPSAPPSDQLLMLDEGVYDEEMPDNRP